VKIFASVHLKAWAWIRKKKPKSYFLLLWLVSMPKTYVTSIQT